MNTVYCDLDGTIIDVYDRYLGIINDYLNRNNVRNISRESYIRLKMTSLKDHEIIFNLTGFTINIDEYLIFKRAELEKKERLKQDYLICDPHKIKEELLQHGYRFVLLTLRNNITNCLEQLDWLNIRNAFDDIFIVQKIVGKNPKTECIRNISSPGDFIIGDSDIDMKCADDLRIGRYFVRTGLFNLEEYPQAANINEAIEKICFR